MVSDHVCVPLWRLARAIGASGIAASMAVAFVGFVGCGERIDGAPSTDFADASGTACTADVDCGAGRHCGGGVCALDCITQTDCGPSLACSPCGRCVADANTDQACLPITNRACAADVDCTVGAGAGWSCGPDKTCARQCSADDQCANLGLGYACITGLCLQACYADQSCWLHGFGHKCVLPSGVNGATNFESDSPVIGHCETDDSGITFPTVSASDPPSAQLAGVWGFMIVAAATTKNIPIFNEINTASVEHWLVRVTRNGAGVQLDERMCDLSLVNFNADDTTRVDLFTISIPSRFVFSVRALENQIAMVPPLTAGATFDFPPQVDLRGAKLDHPATDPMPSYKDLATAWDQDHDGHPGMTKNVTGALSGDLYQADRFVGALHATVFDADHLGGLADGPSDQGTLGASTASLVNDSYTVAYPEADRTYFRAMRLPTTATCADLTKLGATPASWVYWYRHYDATAKPGTLPAVDPATLN